MEISQMFSKKKAVAETQGLIHGDQLKLKKMNGYGGLGTCFAGARQLFVRPLAELQVLNVTIKPFTPFFDM